MSRLPLSLRLARGVLAAAPLLAALQACGRSEPGDYLFDDGESGSASGGKSGAGTAGKPTKGGTSSKGGTGSGATAGTVGVAGAAGSTFGGFGMGGTGIGGTGTGGTGIGGVAGDPGVAGEPNLPDVKCGNDVCNTATEQCCASLAGFGCISNKLMCNGAVLECTSADDCGGGDVCCLSFTAPTGSASTCKNRCLGMNADLERQLCANDAECTGNRRCTATVFGVNVCTRRP